jgi:hypothetical protein
VGSSHSERVFRASPVSPPPRSQEPFRWSTNDLVFSFDVRDGRLRQKCLLPAGAAPGANTSSGVEWLCNAAEKIRLIKA